MKIKKMDSESYVICVLFISEIVKLKDLDCLNGENSYFGNFYGEYVKNSCWDDSVNISKVNFWFIFNI